jgi:hypothetical protein
MALPALRRRVVLRLLAAGTASAALPPSCTDLPDPEPPAPDSTPRFFDDEERRAAKALADHVLPPDGSPGAAALGAVDYMERLMTVLERGDLPFYHAGGPFSGRQPFPAEGGAPGDSFPPDGFASAVPLDRVTLSGLRLFLYGSAGTPGGGPNDGVLGPVTGMRDLLKSGVRSAIAAAPGPLEDLDADALAKVWSGLSTDFHDAFSALVVEGVLSAPEYGGNKDLGGWKLAHFEGDSLPLGYTYFDETKGDYVERPDAPVSTADPGEDPDPLDDATLALLDSLVKSAGGKKFS